MENPDYQAEAEMLYDAAEYLRAVAPQLTFGLLFHLVGGSHENVTRAAEHAPLAVLLYGYARRYAEGHGVTIDRSHPRRTLPYHKD